MTREQEKFDKFFEKYGWGHKSFFNRPHWTRRRFFQVFGAGVTASYLTQRYAKAQAVINSACGADIAKLCSGQTGPAARRCLGQNRASLSSQCKTALASLRRNGRGGGGGGPGGP